MENVVKQSPINVSIYAWHKIALVKASIDCTDGVHGDALSLKQLALQHNMSKSLISKAFVNRYCISIHQYIIKIRMEKATVMLSENRSRSICEIAEQLGYSICSNFSRDFKKYTGMLPLELSKKMNYLTENGAVDVNRTLIV
jgi:AraC-like DNA-binding protein